ncbi:MAG TPA: 3'(2'),5'-bisphosphate nucleotidase CysQ [Pyrinomonadaceae bacterium]|jgi:3'(2'), 5'-bisphosphate nucleotidase
MLEKELETAIAAARAAGEKILEFYALEIITEQKIGADNHYEPVTIADRTASRIIVENLARAFPGDGILSEEEDDVVEIRAARRRVWMIDPIDGTWGFINKDGDFGVQIGLTEGGEAILGVVYLPVHNQLYYAVKGAGAFLVEGEAPPRALRVSGRNDFSEMTIAVSRNHLSPKMGRVSESFKFRDVIRRGSVGLKLGLIAKQAADLYIHLSPRTKFWDSCAPQIILEEAGGRMTDLFGAPLRYDSTDVQNHNGLLASNGAAHEMAVEKMRALLSEFGRLKVTKANKV